MEVKITDNSEFFKKEKNEAVRRALESIGITAERHAKEQCPVDTGLLRNSITHAISGEAPAIRNYHATYGSNTSSKTGKRYTASSKNAGSVGFGSYSGTAPNDPEDSPAVYIGTNVVYARRQETGDYKHKSGAAHFMRDAVTNHGEEYKRVAEVQLRKK